MRSVSYRSSLLLPQGRRPPKTAQAIRDIATALTRALQSSTLTAFHVTSVRPVDITFPVVFWGSMLATSGGGACRRWGLGVRMAYGGD